MQSLFILCVGFPTLPNMKTSVHMEKSKHCDITEDPWFTIFNLKPAKSKG